MSKKKIDPYKLDSFWIELVDRKLSTETLTPDYERRLKEIKHDATLGIGKEGTVGNHYPRQRK